MKLPKIVKLEIIDDQPEEMDDRVLLSYYLLNPKDKKLSILKEAVEKLNVLNCTSIEGLWQIEDFIKENFRTINIERTEIKW